MYEQLNKTETALVELLIKDSRMSYAELGRRLNLSRSAVRDLVRSLMKRGIIESFSAVVNPKALGWNLSVFFEVDVEPKELQNVAAQLVKMENVLSVNQMSGPSTLHVHVIVRDSNHLESFLSKQIYTLPGATGIRTYILLKSFKSKTRGGVKVY